MAGRNAERGSTVVDVSVAAAWCFEDETSAFTEAVLIEVVRGGAQVPALWTFEVANVLAMAERRGRVDHAQVGRFLDALLALPIAIERSEQAALAPALVRIARAQGLSAYDAAYLELAMRMDLPLATQDADLRSAAQRVGVTLLEA